MRLPAFTDRRRAPLQWVIIVLLSAIGATAQAGWQCAELPNGLWECITPPPPQAIPADDNILSPEDTDADSGEIVAPVPEETKLFAAPAPTVPATLDTADTAVAAPIIRGQPQAA